jgi:hypothetical protein
MNGDQAEQGPHEEGRDDGEQTAESDQRFGEDSRFEQGHRPIAGLKKFDARAGEGGKKDLEFMVDDDAAQREW